MIRALLARTIEALGRAGDPADTDFGDTDSDVANRCAPSLAQRLVDVGDTTHPPIKERPSA